ncbi:hypothetical protein B0E38_02614 [Streptomyces sp. 111WW2]|uniref:hypothetical protein n=1 Tax=Streptomyces sp. 111WW2 TaxID=1945515 RepID=UPI000D0C79F0|nr:hypothetical protein [Streptomyces sp. 111WW2]PSK57083.1 hypothetical protein B0E38_02614 [Streptomyces sp. 111WW2]
MSEPCLSIGQQLDAMGLTLDVPEGHHVREATVHLVTGQDGHGHEIHPPVKLPSQGPGSVPVPHPVERRIVTIVSEGQQVSDEQRERVRAWLRANGIDPARVALRDITVECTMHGDQPGRQVIGFTEYYENPDGQREMNWKTREGALTFQRWTVQQVPIEPDPSWQGWPKWYAEMAAKRAEQEHRAGDDA